MPRVGDTVRFKGFYTVSGVGTDCVATMTITDPAENLDVNAQATTQGSPAGWRYYDHVVDAPGMWAGTLITADATVDQKHIPCAVWVDPALATDAATIAAAVWAYVAGAGRTLTSFGTLVTDVATAVWAAGARTLTSFATLATDAAAAVWAYAVRTLTSGGVTVISPVSAGGTVLTLVRGDSYVYADGGTPVEFINTASTWPNLAGATVRLTIRSNQSDTLICTVVGSVIVPSGATAKVRFEPTSTDLASLPTHGLAQVASGKFDVEATLASGNKRTLVLGTVIGLEDQTR